MQRLHSIDLFFFCLESEDFCAFKPFVSFIWRSLPLNESSILETSLVVGQGRKLSFLELCSLCPDPDGKTYASLLKHIHSKSTVGWLTENVVDCYIARTVEACNHLLGSLFFGCLDCCWNLAKCIFSKRQVLPRNNFHSTEDKVLLRQNIFFPVLWKRHFTVMSYRKSNSTLTLYNSTSDCNSALIKAIEKNMTAFLSSFASASQWRSQPNNFGGVKFLILGE